MAARVITITSGKGGVGKTTMIANLGIALAVRGQRVVAIDADIGLRNLDVLLGLENRIVYDLIDVSRGGAGCARRWCATSGFRSCFCSRPHRPATRARSNPRT